MTHDPAVHRIRLRGPWQFARLDGREPSTGTFQHPEEWKQTVGDQGGSLELRRKFHAPSNLDDDEDVFLVLTGVRGDGQVNLNGTTIGEFTSAQTVWEFLLPRPLPRFNQLTISISFPPATSDLFQTGLYDVVLLEIRHHGSQ